MVQWSFYWADADRNEENENGGQSEGAQAEDGVWIVNNTLDFGRYPDITVKAGIPVKWTIDVPKGYVNGCDHCDRLRFVISLKKKCDAAIIQIKNGKGREMWKIQ